MFFFIFERLCGFSFLLKKIRSIEVAIFNGFYSTIYLNYFFL